MGEENSMNVLRGNYELDTKVVRSTLEGDAAAGNIREQLKQKVLASLGGSMVYVERNLVSWDGEAQASQDSAHGKPENKY